MTTSEKLTRDILRLIKSKTAPDEEFLTEEFSDFIPRIRDFYGLAHARFVMTSEGMAQIREKYLNKVFGYCPRILCEKHPVIPMGLCDDLKYSRMKAFCPRCKEIYKPKVRCVDIDGAYFGQSFPQAFLLVHL